VSLYLHLCLSVFECGIVCVSVRLCVFLLCVVDGLTEILSVSVYYLQSFITIHDPRDSVRISSMLIVK